MPGGHVLHVARILCGNGRHETDEKRREKKSEGDGPLSLVLGANRMGHLVRQKLKTRNEISPMVVDRIACVVNHGPSNLSEGTQVSL